MRKLWPPIYDGFTLRFWATIAAVSINLFAVLLAYLHIAFDLMLVLIWPGFIAFLLVTGQNIEDTHFSWLGIIVDLTVNVAFYYGAAGLLILIVRRLAQPTREWWPGKPS